MLTCVGLLGGRIVAHGSTSFDERCHASDDAFAFETIDPISCPCEIKSASPAIHDGKLCIYMIDPTKRWAGEMHGGAQRRSKSNKKGRDAQKIAQSAC
jgi:hypothetical protein